MKLFEHETDEYKLIIEKHEFNTNMYQVVLYDYQEHIIAHLEKDVLIKLTQALNKNLF